MDEHVIYHWWADPSDPKEHWKNLRSPIILSIATLRAHNPDIKIDVLDCTDYSYIPLGPSDERFSMIDGRKQFMEDLDDPQWMAHQKAEYKQQSKTRWGEYPFKLRFNVHKQDLYLSRNYSDKPGHKHLSRIFDLEHAQPMVRERYLTPSSSAYTIPEDKIIIYSDADVFWLKDPLPLIHDGNKVCFNGYNTGFFYYRPASKEVWRFFELFKAYTMTALNNDVFREELKQFVGYDDWYFVFDEMTMSYMFNRHGELFDNMKLKEHCTIRELASMSITPKMLHGNGAMMHNPLAKHAGEKQHCRGLFCLIWTEFWGFIRQVLDDNDIAEIFTVQELDYFKPHQYSLLNERRRVEATKSIGGHFNIHQSLTATLI